MILIGLCYAFGLCHSFKSCALPPSLLSHALFLSPQCCLYNLLEGQPENSWSLGEKCYIISNLSRYSSLHLSCFLQYVHQPPRASDRHTIPARSPSVDGIPSRAIRFPRIMFATLGVSPAGRLGSNPYHHSPKFTIIPLDQISTPLLRNIWSVAS